MLPISHADQDFSDVRTLKLFPFAWLSSTVSAGTEIKHTAGKKLGSIFNKCSIFPEKNPNFAQAMKMYEKNEK